ncbi:type IV toxin-antitoxin system AbiEi family antitoxin [Zhongshania sp.]|uniref:type IV toxin-antitoxin system AbiEi family antitoxin n=1 Tax=Zhongshania sp. TaxID=1971902 RepID=UPI003568A422
MHTAYDEQHIAEVATAELRKETGLQVRFEGYDANGVDGFIYIDRIGEKLTAEIKKWTTHTPVGTLINKMKEIARFGGGVLIADYINPRMAEKLKAADIQFLDTAGNAYLNKYPIYICITGKRLEENTALEKPRGRAFQPTGMKVVYEFLVDKTLVNAPYREIADRANVALGAVGWVIRDLVEQGFLIERQKERQLTNYDELLDKWVENYPQKLRKKLLLGKFTTDEGDWWQKIDPCDYNAVWGGEVAAAKYTNYLTPKDVTIYIPKEKMPVFLKDARLRRAHELERPHLTIEVLEPIGQHTELPPGLAHPILVYADLLVTGNTRNIETAQKLREQYID